MKYLITILAAAMAASASAEDLRKLDARDLSPLDAKPTGTALPPGTTAKGLTAKSARISPSVERVEQRRSYFSKGATNAKSAVARPNAVKIEFTDGTFVEQPLVEVPLLFHVGTAELLDSRNLEPVVAKVREVIERDPDARFRVEGHASAEGDGAANEKLARDRAEVIQQTLARALAANSGSIRPEGRGNRDATAPADAADHLLQKDRKVLVVREK